MKVIFFFVYMLFSTIVVAQPDMTVTCIWPDYDSFQGAWNDDRSDPSRYTKFNNDAIIYIEGGKIRVLKVDHGVMDEVFAYRVTSDFLAEDLDEDGRFDNTRLRFTDEPALEERFVLHWQEIESGFKFADTFNAHLLWQRFSKKSFTGEIAIIDEIEHVFINYTPSYLGAGNGLWCPLQKMNQMVNFLEENSILTVL